MLRSRDVARDRRQPRPDRHRAGSTSAAARTRRCTRCERTRRTLGAGQPRAWLATLPPHRVLDEARAAGARRRARRAAVHGDARRTSARTPPTCAADFPGARVCFFGHSHEQRVYEVAAKTRRTEIPTRWRGSSAAGEHVLHQSRHRSTPRARAATSSPSARSSTARSGTVEFLRVPLRRRRHRGQGGGVRLPHQPLTPRQYRFGSITREAPDAVPLIALAVAEVRDLFRAGLPSRSNRPSAGLTARIRPLVVARHEVVGRAARARDPRARHRAPVLWK